MIFSKTKDPQYRKKYCDDCRKIVSSEKSKEQARKRTKPYKNKDGYVWIRTPDDRWMPEHRYVMEQKIQRPLKEGVESVHHINGIRDDNRPENLELWVGAIRYGQRASDVKCHNCGHAYAI
jgi:hypothetical protein